MAMVVVVVAVVVVIVHCRWWWCASKDVGIVGWEFEVTMTFWVVE